MSNPVTKEQFQVIKFLVDMFDTFDIKYFMDDGLAAIIYGSKRKLYDIDLCLDKPSMDKVRKIFNDLATKPYSYQKFKDCHIWLLTLNINGVPIDAMMEKHAFIYHERDKKHIKIALHDLFEHTRILSWKGLRLRVKNPENLFVEKLFINRKCDIIDAKAIMENNILNPHKLLELYKQFGIKNKLKKLL